jgi:hypothetical protein
VARTASTVDGRSARRKERGLSEARSGSVTN